MKYLIAFCLISSSVLATNDAINKEFDLIDDVKSLDLLGETYTVKFESFNGEFKIPRSHSIIPCLENARKSGMQVALHIDRENERIENCYLYSTPGPAR
jgi:hypothetical protein